MTSLRAYENLNGLLKITCDSCGKKRLYFCYDCHKYVSGMDQKVPSIELPVSVEIIKHPAEKNSKSTAIHCKLLAPNQTRIFDSKGDIPYFNNSKQFPNTVLVYPDTSAISIAEYVKENGPIQTYIFLDATWQTVKEIKRKKELRGIPTVMLRTYETEYWRPQNGLSNKYLATIEAIRYAIEENADASGTPFNAETLLFWFYYFRQMVDQNLCNKHIANDNTNNITETVTIKDENGG
uniref:tRNA-uridine aminocarboxypropyltransferase 1 n=1 Tax=Panagrolaimus superbus TaxID=310955 RepID=A0A914XUG5_9BILA